MIGRWCHGAFTKYNATHLNSQTHPKKQKHGDSQTQEQFNLLGSKQEPFTRKCQSGRSASGENTRAFRTDPRTFDHSSLFQRRNSKMKSHMFRMATVF